MRFLLTNGDRKATLDIIRSLAPTSLLDIGSVDDPWVGEFVTATVDLRESTLKKPHFRGDINNDVWTEIFEWTEKHGKFSFSVCAHTLEDIAFPTRTLQMLPVVSERGMISFPSHWRELMRGIEGPWRGFIHHRWMFRERNGELLLIPKLPFLEHSELIAQCPEDQQELQVWWEGALPFRILNDDYLGPNPQVLWQIYEEALR